MYPVLSSTDGEVLFGYAATRAQARHVARAWLRARGERHRVGRATLALHAPSDLHPDYDGYPHAGRPVFTVAI